MHFSWQSVSEEDLNKKQRHCSLKQWTTAVTLCWFAGVVTHEQ